MSGVEFLCLVKERYPDVVRMVLSGYADLQSVTDAVNEGAVYKFMTKPWDDEQLIGSIRDAFELKRMADENTRLSQELQLRNTDLALVTRQLQTITSQAGSASAESAGAQ